MGERQVGALSNGGGAKAAAAACSPVQPAAI